MLQRNVYVKVPRITFVRTKWFAWDSILLTLATSIFTIGATILFVLLVDFWGHALLNRSHPLSPEQSFIHECISDGGTTNVSTKNWQCNNPYANVSD